MYPPADLRGILRRALAPPGEPPEGPEGPEDPEDPEAAGARPAAVLVPVVDDGAPGGPRVLFTRRTEDLSRHPGEISFPGGLAEPGEELVQTALRETREEIGLDPGAVEVMGALPAVHTRVTGILISPFVGMLAVLPPLRPAPREIAEVLLLPLSTLARVGEERPFEFEGRTYRTHVFEVDGSVVWGATARILRTFLDSLGPAGAA